MYFFFSSVSNVYPVFQPAKWILTVMNQDVTINTFAANETIPLGMDIADGLWHFIVISWDLTGHTKIFIDSIEKVDMVSVSADDLPKM